MSRQLVAPALALFVVTFSACNSQPLAPSASQSTPTATSGTAAKGGRGALGVVYVTGQGLYYDTFVAKDPLPMQGKFQKIENGTTAYGPGDPEYLGGRWWDDVNGDGIQNAGDHFFLCPLLPPGRPTP